MAAALTGEQAILTLLLHAVSLSCAATAAASDLAARAAHMQLTASCLWDTLRSWSWVPPDLLCDRVALAVRLRAAAWTSSAVRLSGDAATLGLPACRHCAAVGVQGCWRPSFFLWAWLGRQAYTQVLREQLPRWCGHMHAPANQMPALTGMNMNGRTHEQTGKDYIY